MKNLIMFCVLFLSCVSVADAQYPSVIGSQWVPVVVNKTEYVQQVVPVTTYHTINTPVNITAIQYFRVPVLYYGPYYYSSVGLYQPYYVQQPGPIYYVNPPYRCFKY